MGGSPSHVYFGFLMPLVFEIFSLGLGNFLYAFTALGRFCMLLRLSYLLLLSWGVLGFSSWSVMINLTHQLDRVESHLEDSLSGMPVGDTFIVLTGVEELFTRPLLPTSAALGLSSLGTGAGYTKTP